MFSDYKRELNFCNGYLSLLYFCLCLIFLLRIHKTFLFLGFYFHYPSRGYDKAIVIVRDPLFAALSDFHRTKSGSDRHISHANRNFFDDGKKWHEFAIKYVSKWKWFFDVIFKRYGAKNK